MHLLIEGVVLSWKAVIYRIYMNLATARRALKEPGPEEWHLNEGMMSVLRSNHTRNLFCLSNILMPVATLHFCVSFPFLDSLPNCQLYHL